MQKKLPALAPHIQVRRCTFQRPKCPKQQSYSQSCSQKQRYSMECTNISWHHAKANRAPLFLTQQLFSQRQISAIVKKEQQNAQPQDSEDGGTFLTAQRQCPSSRLQKIVFNFKILKPNKPKQILRPVEELVNLRQEGALLKLSSQPMGLEQLSGRRRSRATHYQRPAQSQYVQLEKYLELNDLNLKVQQILRGEYK